MNRWSLDQIMSPEFHYNFFSVTKKQIALFHPHYFVVKFFSVLQKTHTQNQLSIFIWVPSTQEGAPLMTKHDSTICWLLLKELPMLFKRSWSRLLTFLYSKTCWQPPGADWAKCEVESGRTNDHGWVAFCWLATKIVMSYLDTFSAITSSQIRFLQID